MMWHFSKLLETTCVPSNLKSKRLEVPRLGVCQDGDGARTQDLEDMTQALRSFTALNLIQTKASLWQEV